MSLEQAKAFVQKLSSDETLYSQVVAAEDNEARLAVAREAGYNFTGAEYQQSVAAQAEGELSDDELEQVAGGADSDQSGLPIEKLEIFNSRPSGRLGSRT